MQELISQRSYTRKVILKDNGDKLYRFHTAHKHFKDINGNFQTIDTRLIVDPITKSWKHSSASYHPTIPEFSDDWFEFLNKFEGANHTIKARPVASHVKGVYAEELDGSVAVTYPEAFGKGIDLKRRKDVFRPGYSTKRRGWGLGLSLAKRIIEGYHGGKLILKSSVQDEGTTFIILLKSC